MGTIMARQKKDGAKSFTAVRRRKKGGRPAREAGRPRLNAGAGDQGSRQG